MPLAATTGRAEVMDTAHIGGIGGTYGGNPLACVAAIESIKAISDPGVPGRGEGGRRRYPGPAARDAGADPGDPAR